MTDHDPNPKPGNETRDDEPVSALVDGELDARGAEFVIRRIAGDDGLSRRWYRFHIVRACLQGEFSGSVSLVSRVQAALADEASPAGRPRAASRLLRLAGGGAVAAGVAMMAVVGLGNRVDQQIPASTAGADAPGFVSETTALDRQFNAPAVPAGFGGVGGEARRASAAVDARASRARINRYVIRHSQAAGGNGFTSFAPVLTAPASVRVANPETTDTESGSGETGRERGE